MDNKRPCTSNNNNSSHQDDEVRKGPWTMEEDLILINYIANHGGGVWNSLAKSAGLKRTGKSCRLRWLNYLRPDVRRGNITLEEQLLIMELHAKWGNSWSKIAKHLPGRTDNEIKNYWRTRIQKHIKQGENSSGQSSEQINIIDYHHQQGSCSTQINHNHNENGVDNNAIIDTYSPPSYIGNMDTFQPPLPTDQSNENIWSIDDLWSLQLLNGE